MPDAPLVTTEHGVFLTTDAEGAVPPEAPGTLGLFYRDTRFLSGLDLRLDGERPPALSVDDHGWHATITYDAQGASKRGTAFPARLLLQRERYIDAPAAGPPALRERLSLTSYGREALDVTLEVVLAADFHDMFTVRGFLPLPPGTHAPLARPTPEWLEFGYEGRDGVARRTRVHCDPAPSESAEAPVPEGRGARLRFLLHLEPRQPASVELAVQLLVGAETAAAPTPPPSFDDGLAALQAAHDRWLSDECAAIETDHPLLNAVLDQGLRDLRLLLLATPTGPYVAAGIPWFDVPFGRDGIIAALQLLSVNPAVAVGTLRFLAAHQGKAVDPKRDEEPGKIMHELRSGEAVGSGAAPFGPYYGTVDATPLFLVLLGRALAWLDDDALARELLPAARAALAWLDGHGDPDGDGLIEYARKADGGLANQGWKDSGDSLQFPDGSFPEPPIALVEVQGYTYEARLAGAALLERLGDAAGAAAQRGRAQKLRERFDAQFWLADEGCYAQALDADKRPVPAVTSNVGHVLWSGLAEGERATVAARRLVADDMRAGWGVRTLSARYPSYNPLSYHNGSIWPHDNSLVVAGLKRAGQDAAAADVFAEVLAAAAGYRDVRLPELYCGLPRTAAARGPVPYPVSCSPQAWAAGSAFLMLQSVLGLEADAAAGVLHLRPWFPAGLSRVTLRRLRVGQHRFDLTVTITADGMVKVERTTASGEVFRAEAKRGEGISVPAGQAE